MPFLISDLTSREKRVPMAGIVHHPNGACGVFRLLISASSEDASDYARLVGAPPEDSSFQLGNCVVEISSATETAASGPETAVLKTSRAGGELDRRLTHGAAVRLEQLE